MTKLDYCEVCGTWTSHSSGDPIEGWIDRLDAMQRRNEEAQSTLGAVSFGEWTLLLFAGIGIVWTARWFIILLWAVLG